MKRFIIALLVTSILAKDGDKDAEACECKFPFKFQGLTYNKCAKLVWDET